MLRLLWMSGLDSSQSLWISTGCIRTIYCFPRRMIVIGWWVAISNGRLAIKTLSTVVSGIILSFCWRLRLRAPRLCLVLQSSSSCTTLEVHVSSWPGYENARGWDSRILLLHRTWSSVTYGSWLERLQRPAVLHECPTRRGKLNNAVRFTYPLLGLHYAFFKEKGGAKGSIRSEITAWAFGTSCK